MRPASFLPVLTLIACTCDTEVDNSFRSEEVNEPSGPVVVAQFNAQNLDTPEGIAVDHAGNVLVSMALTGEIRQVAPDGTQSTRAFIPIGFPFEECHGFIAFMHALAVDSVDNVYVSAAACDLENRGYWRVTPSGETSVVAHYLSEERVNGLMVHEEIGTLFGTNTFRGQILIGDMDGFGETVGVWLESELLDPISNPFSAPGGNGIQLFHNELLVVNSSAQTILAVPIGEFGEPGEIYVKYNFPPGCDDFAVDVQGALYCTTNPFQTVVRINLDGSQTQILGPDSGVDGPTAAVFGRGMDNRTLYISNAAFPFFPGTGAGPSVLKVDVKIPGYPLR